MGSGIQTPAPTLEQQVLHPLSRLPSPNHFEIKED